MDTAEERAEIRAILELQIKADTLTLEREKFVWTRARGYPERLGAVSMRVATALLFANGSTGLVCLNSYKALGEVLTPPVVQQIIVMLLAGFTTAIGAYIGAALLAVAAMDDFSLKISRTIQLAFLACGCCMMLSFAALGLALTRTVAFLTSH